MSGISGGITSLIAGSDAKAAAGAASAVSANIAAAQMNYQMHKDQQMMDLLKPYTERELSLADQQIAMNEISQKAAEMGIDFQEWYQGYTQESTEWGYEQGKKEREWGFDTLQRQTGMIEERGQFSFDTLKDAVAHRDEMQNQFQEVYNAGPGEFEDSAFYKSMVDNTNRAINVASDKLMSAGLAGGPTGTIGTDLMDYATQYATEQAANKRGDFLNEWASTKLAPAQTLLADSNNALGGEIIDPRTGSGAGVGSSSPTVSLGGGGSPSGTYGSGGYVAQATAGMQNSADNIGSILGQHGANSAGNILGGVAAQNQAFANSNAANRESAGMILGMFGA